MCRANPLHGRYIACALLLRGRVSPKEVDEQVLSIQNRNSSYFIGWADWISGHIHSSICDVPPEGFDIHGTYLANSTTVQELFKIMEDNFSAMFRRKAFLHWYINEGMEEMEFTEAQSAM